jgi:hypothetical protein
MTGVAVRAASLALDNTIFLTLILIRDMRFSRRYFLEFRFLEIQNYAVERVVPHVLKVGAFETSGTTDQVTERHTKIRASAAV